jgi:hypothetical protein
VRTQSKVKNKSKKSESKRIKKITLINLICMIIAYAVDIHQPNKRDVSGKSFLIFSYVFLY